MAIAFDAKAQGTIGAALLGFSLTVGASANFLVVGAGVRSAGASITGVTFNGAALTLAKQVNNAGNGAFSSIWYKQAPFVGTSTVFVTQSGTGSQHGLAASFSGVDQTGSVLEATGSDIPNANNTTISVLTLTDGAVVVDHLINESNSNSSIASGQTLLFSTDQGVWATAGSYIIKSPAGTQFINWTNAAADFSAHTAAAFKPAASSGAAVSATGFMTSNSKFWGI